MVLDVNARRDVADRRPPFPIAGRGLGRALFPGRIFPLGPSLAVLAVILGLLTWGAPGIWSGVAMAQRDSGLPVSVLNRLNAVIATRSRANANGVDLRLNNPNGIYQEGERTVFKITGPRFPAYIYLDHYKSDGTVTHLLPGPTFADAPLPERQQMVVRRTQSDGPIVAGPPFGRELIVLLASPEPLLRDQRPESEPADDYLDALKPNIYGLPVPEPNKDLTVVFQYLTVTPGDPAAPGSESLEMVATEPAVPEPAVPEPTPEPVPVEPAPAAVTEDQPEEVQSGDEQVARAAVTDDAGVESSGAESMAALPPVPVEEADLSAAPDETQAEETQPVETQAEVSSPESPEADASDSEAAIVAQKEGQAETIWSGVPDSAAAQADVLVLSARLSELLSNLESAPWDEALVTQLVTAYGDMAEALIARQKPEKAMHSLAMANALAPGNERIARLEEESSQMTLAQKHIQEGIAHLAAGDATMAYDSFNKVLAVQPANQEARQHLAAIQPTVAEIYNDRALAAFKRKDLNAAVAYWDQLLEIDPSNQQAESDRQHVLDLLGRKSF